MIRLGVTTAPRPNGQFYLPTTLASLESTGFSPPYQIFAEPHTPIDDEVYRRHDVLTAETKRGEWRNWLDAIEVLLAIGGDPLAIMTVQDDVIFCRRIREFLEARLWPSERCGLVQVYTGRRYRGQPDFPLGLTKLPLRFVRDMNAACALAFRPAVLGEILEHAKRHPWKGRHVVTDNPAEVNELDVAIGTALRELDYDIWSCNPSLGCHIGTESALSHGGPNGNRQALDFPGEDADAFEVIR
jgi:hypothetical protein